MKTNRNYQAEMLDRIKKAIPTWDYVPSVVAETIVEEAGEQDRELLVGFLLEQAVPLIAEMIVEISRSQRRIARTSTTKTGKFAEAARQFESGDKNALSPFYAEFTVDVEHTRRKAMDMTGPDHLFVAKRYRQSETKAKMEAVFHEAVAKKIGGLPTRAVFTEDQYDKLYRSIAEL